MSFDHSVPDFFFADINECKAGKHNCVAKLIAKTLKGPLCAPVSQGILEMELAAQVKTIPWSSLQRIFF